MAGKVNRICDAFIHTLKSTTNTNLQNLVTAHVCKSPPDLDDGLRLVAGLRGMSMVLFLLIRGLPRLVSNPAQADEAIEHMCFLADANRLYEHALGLYDLDLTLLIAQQAQRVSFLSNCNPTAENN